MLDTTVIPASLITFIIIHSSTEFCDHFLNRGNEKQHLNS